MSALLGFLLGMLAVVGAFGFIIFIHEIGHFLAARAVDIRCPQFAIGFGPQLFGFRWRGTNFAVRLFPLGGYVLMQGEEPGATSDPWAEAVAKYLNEETFPAEPSRLLAKLDAVPELERGEAWREVRDQVAYARTSSFPTLKSVEGNFHDRSIPARILVISGGVIMNFLATIIILWSLAPVVGVGSFFSDWGAVVSQVEAGTPADKAGIVSGDKIVAVNGRPIGSYIEASEAIAANPGKATKVEVETRDGKKQLKTVTPLLSVGSVRFEVGEDGKLFLVSATNHPQLVNKYVTSPDVTKLLETVRARGADRFELQFEGEAKPVVFELNKDVAKPRGQIGIRFGVSDIRFEKDLTVKVASVNAGSPAEVAGVKAGDELILVGGFNLLSNGDLGFGSLVEPALQAFARLESAEPMELGVLRDGKFESLTIKDPVGLTTLSSLGVELFPLTQADRLKAPFQMIGTLVMSPYMILRAWLDERATGSEIVDSMQGPVGIMTLIYQLSDNGILQFLFFVALLNAAIGAFNLLPFPALDGARLVFLAIAGLRGGRQVDPDKEAKVHLLGLMVLLCFVVVVTFGDIKKLIASQLFVM